MTRDGVQVDPKLSSVTFIYSLLASTGSGGVSVLFSLDCVFSL